MSFSQLLVLYGNLEGTDGKFARDPSGYLSIEAGIFRKHGLDVSWQHVQGTEERYRRLNERTAHISFVVGRAALQHFLKSRTTRILGSAMNTCPYYLLVEPSIKEIRDLKGKTVGCREGPGQVAPLAQAFQQKARLSLGEDVTLRLLEGDRDTFNSLVRGQIQAALMPRPYGFIAEEKGFRRLTDWPDIVDDPLPITIETTESLLRENEDVFGRFLEAHREGIRYSKTNRAQTILMLEKCFGHSPMLAATTFDEYLLWLDDRLTIEFRHLERLVAQVAPDFAGGARELASEWLLPTAVTG